MKRNVVQELGSGPVVPLVFFVFFFIINGFLGFFTIRKVTAEQDLVNLARRNINLVNELHIEVLRAETGQRGYLLTNLDSYAAPYNDAMAAIGGKVADFATTTLDAPQQERFERLRVVVDEKRKELSDTVSDIRANRDDDAIQELFTHRGRDLMGEIEALSLEMEAYERHLLDERMNNLETGRVDAFYLVLAANLVGLVMVFVAGVLIRKGHRNENRLLASLREANDTLEARVEERTSTLEVMSTELRRSNRELQDFAFVASHDLQEPLRKIRAFGDRLHKEFSTQLGPEGGDYVNRMQNASQRMSTLIEDLLVFSRITTRTTPFVQADLNLILARIQEDLEVTISEANATLEVDELPTVEGDASQLHQLFQNLLSNALKFRDAERRPEIRVFVSSVKDATIHKGVTITVQDNGIGFDPAFSERIFQPFQRLHGKTEYRGTGIGLAICRRIAERHLGTITVESKPGEGSSFHVTLPRQQLLAAQGVPAT